MSQSAVLSSAKSVVVTLDDLKRLPAPKPMGPRHVPVPHHLFVEELQNQLLDRGYVAHRQQLAVDHQGVRLFGAIDFVPAGTDKLVEGQDLGMSVGIRHANDRTISLGMVTGGRVFVCDNLVFAGEMVVLRRKHTTRLDLELEVGDALDLLFERYAELDTFIARLKDTELKDDRARLTIYRAFLEADVMAPQYIPDVHGWYFDPPEGATDVEPRSAWGAYNAFTRVVRDLAPHRVQPTTLALTNFFKDTFKLN